jgi:ketosteroid isomerase-like protein
MADDDRLQVARDCYRAYETGDRDAIERRLSADFTFSSPADVAIGRERYFERCWPNAEQLQAFEFKRLVSSGDEVIVTYEATRIDGSRFRNTEVLTFSGEQISSIEVYFGWNLG